MIKEYKKLVRDRIPEIIKESGGKPQVATLDKENFFRVIKIKIEEEAYELLQAEDREKIIDEIIDIQELIDTLIAEMGITRFEFWELQRRKNKERGGFKKRLFLIKTETEPHA